jgi:hypothetical protein
MSENTLVTPAEEEAPMIENPYVRELVDNLLKDAARLAKKSSEHTAEQLLAGVGFYVLVELPRLQSRRPNAWNLFQRLEKENAPEEVRKQVDTVSYDKSRPGVKGDYQLHMKERWNNDPELRKKYERLAKERAAASAAANDAPDGAPPDDAADNASDRENIQMDPALEAMDEEMVEVELMSVKEMQKKSLKTLKKLVR